jgi:hypothetical protein
MSAAVWHEMGHLNASDNLKRPLMRACLDALPLIPCVRSIDRAWKEASEAAADEFTARADRAQGALALASAIIKIARQIPKGASPALPAGAFLIAEAGDDIARRISLLIRLAEREAPGRRSGMLFLQHSIRMLLCVGLVTLTLLVTQTNILFRSHLLIEHLVSALR